MKVAIGNDHRGVAVKNTVIAILREMGISVEDFGSNEEKAADYSLYGFKVAQAVSQGSYDSGILICSNGIGMSIVANKVKGVRAALCSSIQDSTNARNHNNANILILREGMDDIILRDLLESWFHTEFELGGRHERRVNLIHDLTGV